MTSLILWCSPFALTLRHTRLPFAGFGLEEALINAYSVLVW